MQDVSITDIVVMIFGSGGIIWFIVKQWANMANTRQKAALASAKHKDDLTSRMVESELEEKENFQAQITFQLIEKFLEQFSSYQKQNEQFQEFFFQRLDPMMRALQENSEEVRRLIVQFDLLQRTQRELTNSHKSLSAHINAMMLLMSPAQDTPMEGPPPVLPAATAVRGSVQRRVVQVSKEEEDLQAEELEQ